MIILNTFPRVPDVHVRPFLVFLSALFLFVLCSSANAAVDEQLQRAATLLRAHQYQDALQSALKAPVGGRRSLLAGVAALRSGRYEEALIHLSDAQQTYPLLADHAAALRADALFQLKRYRDAAAAALAATAAGQSPSLARRMEKLNADALHEAGDLKAALAAYQKFSSLHAIGRDSVDARYQAALCRDRLGEASGALAEYRSIWLLHPASSQAEKAYDILKAREKSGNPKATLFTAEELYQRATLLLAANHYSDASWALAAIPRTNLPEELLAQIELKSGQSAIKQRQYTLAEKFLARSAASRAPAVRDEARLALARVEERTGQSERALARLLALAGERSSLSDDALLEAGLAHKHAARFVDAALLFDRLAHDFPKSELVGRAVWEASWSRYLAGDLEGAEVTFRRLQKEDAYRERALYWHGRTLIRLNKSYDAERSFKLLITEFPFGFYAAWRREQTHQPTGWEPFGGGLPEPALPLGSERVLALHGSGLQDEARAELALLKGKGTDKAQAPMIARLQQIVGDYHGSIVTFHQNRPSVWNHTTLPFWALGYPRPYADLFSNHVAANRLSDSLVYSLAKAESNFMAGVKSPAGAIGLMQLMPATAKLTARYKGKKPYNPLWLTDPEYNIRLGTKHLRELLDQYHQDIVYTLAAYNAGAGAVNRWRKSFGHLDRDEFIENIPYQETRDYVKKIVAYTTIYKALYRIP